MGACRLLGRSGARCRLLARSRARLLVLAIVLAGLGALSPPARADGDPASDVLLSQPNFLPPDLQASPRQQSELRVAQEQAERRGVTVRVAIIPSGYDLGSVTALWRKPQVYARFLGIELSLTYRHPLLVVMPDGFGFEWAGHSASSAYRMLADVPIARGRAGLIDAAQEAVRRLGDVSIGGGARSSRAAATTRARGGPDWVVIIAALTVLLLGWALVAGLGPARRRRIAGARRRLRLRRSVFPRLRWAVTSLIAVGLISAGVVIVIARLRSNTLASAVRAAATQTPFTWGADQRRAPNFELRDQNGERVSLSADHGRPVILTFVDPLCRNLCPLEAHVLNRLVDQMPADARPQIIAVSVDVYADSRADLLQDYHRWSLVPQWRWAVGTPAQLRAVWKHYEVGVSVTTKTIAHTTVHFINHDEMSYVIDPAGYERALFVWPFDTQALVRKLRQLSNS
jgi:cytochrome oxidase Cu insertion factor (SCO1/SenC/PrrC family)